MKELKVFKAAAEMYLRNYPESMVKFICENS